MAYPVVPSSLGFRIQDRYDPTLGIPIAALVSLKRAEPTVESKDNYAMKFQRTCENGSTLTLPFKVPAGTKILLGTNNTIYLKYDIGTELPPSRVQAFNPDTFEPVRFEQEGSILKVPMGQYVGPLFVRYVNESNSSGSTVLQSQEKLIDPVPYRSLTVSSLTDSIDVSTVFDPALPHGTLVTVALDVTEAFEARVNTPDTYRYHRLRLRRGSSVLNGKELIDFKPITNLITATNDQDLSGGTIGNWIVGTNGSGTIEYSTDSLPWSPTGRHIKIEAAGDEDWLYAKLATTHWTAMVAGNYYTARALVYVPAANTSKQIHMTITGVTNSPDEAYVLQPNTWTEITATFLAGADVSGDMKIGFKGVDPADGDLCYVAGMAIYEENETDRPQIAVDEKPVILRNGLLKLDEADINVLGSDRKIKVLSSIADLRGSPGIVLKINGQVVTDVDALTASERYGYLHIRSLKITPKDVLTVSYQLQPSKWVVVEDNLNPLHIKNMPRSAANRTEFERNILDGDMEVWVQNDGDLFYRYPHLSKKLHLVGAYGVTTAWPKSTDRLLCTVSLENIVPDMVDIRKQSLGVKLPEDREEIDWRSHSHHGFYGGEAIPSMVIIVKLPPDISELITADVWENYRQYFQEMFLHLVAAGTYVIVQDSLQNVIYWHEDLFNYEQA